MDILSTTPQPGATPPPGPAPGPTSQPTPPPGLAPGPTPQPTPPPGPSCVLCRQPLTDGVAHTLDGRPACASCTAQVLHELGVQRIRGSDLPTAALGGGGCAAFCALLWAALAVVTGYEMGYVAIMLGYCAGWGVKAGAGKARGAPLQWLASLLALGGLVFARYLVSVYSYSPGGRAAGGPELLAWADGRLLAAFLQTGFDRFRPFDVLWIVLAAVVAYRVPRAASVKVS